MTFIGGFLIGALFFNSSIATICSNAVMLSSDDWKRLSIFQPLLQTEVLQTVFEAIENTPPDLTPAVYVDLDATVFDPRPLTFHLFQKWARSEYRDTFPEIADRIRKAHLHEMGHGHQDTWAMLGLDRFPDSDKALIHFKLAWDLLISRETYVKWDNLYPEVTQFFEKLEALSKKRKKPLLVVILTGRHLETDLEPSIDSLARWGLLHRHYRTEFAFRPQRLKTEVFKRNYLADHAKNPEIRPIAFFDNEPINFGAHNLPAMPPTLMPIFMDTVCFHCPPSPTIGIYRIRSFAH